MKSNKEQHFVIKVNLAYANENKFPDIKAKEMQELIELYESSIIPYSKI